MVPVVSIFNAFEGKLENRHELLLKATTSSVSRAATREEAAVADHH